MKSSVVLTSFAALALASGATAVGLAWEGGRPGIDAAQVAAKQARLRSVVAELSSRDASSLSESKRAARARALDLLADYAERADFTVHHELWPREVPLFIDDRGTRCALAAVLDGFGEDAVVKRLATECNDAYLAEIADDSAITRCLDELGLTIDEAAYIQGPGVGNGEFDSAGGNVRVLNADPDSGFGSRAGSGGETGQREDGDFGGRPATGGSTGESGPTTGGTRPPPTLGTGGPTPDRTAGAPSTGGSRPPRGPTTGSRRSREATFAFTWPEWWAANRDEFVLVRARYHDAPPSTPDSTPLRTNRPTSAEIRGELLPLFAAIARDDADLRSTAIAMWARGAQAADAPPVLDAALAYLADPHQADRGWGAVMLAILADPAARAPLAALLTDSQEGRRLLGQTAAVGEGVRALAAIAYGRSGGSIDALLATLADAPAAHQDVAAACVIALGLAARDPAQRAPAIGFLVNELERPTLPASALAQVPAALVLSRDPAALPALHTVVARFRGPRELRRACALALGQFAPELDEPVHAALAALARRDVDAECRHAAIVSLGLLAFRHGATASTEVIARLAAFHEDALAGRFRHDEDLAWHALSAGLFARGLALEGVELLPRLRAIAKDDGDEALRAAACLALGIARDEGAAPLLTDALEHGSELVAGYAAQALGLTGARFARTRLLDLCLSSPTESVGYAAAFALGCLADPSLVEPLLVAFERTPSASVRAGLARALGEIGDRRAIDGLRRIAMDESRDDPSRERALAALGVMAQSDDVAWNSPIKQAVDSAAATPSLRLLMSLF